MSFQKITCCILGLIGGSIGVHAKIIEWSGPTTTYVGFPGVTTERCAFLTKYSTQFWHGETGELVCTQSTDLVDPDLTQVIKFPEIIDPEKLNWLQRKMNALWRSRVWSVQTGASVKKFSRTPYSMLSYGIDRSKVSMGQGNDVDAIRDQLMPAIFPFRTHGSQVKTVWLAYSRGVSALLHFINTLDSHELVYLPDAIILEGGLDVMQHFLQHIFDPYLPAWIRNCKKPQWLIAIMLSLFRYYYAPGYRGEGDEVMNAVAELVAQKIPHDIPILLVSSLGDELVSPKLMIRLYKALRCEHLKSGYNNVHLLLLKNARHSYYVNGITNKNDRDTYEECVHAFYRAYGLAHNSALAERGTAAFRGTNDETHHFVLQGTGCPFCSKDSQSLFL